MKILKCKPSKLPNHSVDLNRFFKRYTKILEEIDYDDLEEGETYINISGHSLKYSIDGDDDIFTFIVRTPLYIWKGDDVEGLTEPQLKLFWILTKNAEKDGL